MQTHPGTGRDPSARPPCPRRRRQVIAALLLATMLLVTPAQPGWADNQAAENPPTVSGVSALRSAIQERLTVAGGQWSVSVGVPGAPDGAIALNANRPVLAASLFKLVLLVEALRLHRAGELDLGERLVMTPAALSLLQPLPSTLRPGETMAAAAALETMITVSSNTAAVLIGQRIGWIRSQHTVARLGLHATSMASQPTTTAADMQRLLRLIAGEPADPRLLHPDDAATMRHLLAQQRINDRVPPELQQAGRIAHKTGDLPRLLHDAGLVTGPTGPIAVVLMATGFTDRNSAVAAMRDVYRAIYQAAEAGTLTAAVTPTTAPNPSLAATATSSAPVQQPVPSKTPNPTETTKGAAEAVAVPTVTPQPTMGAPRPVAAPNAACHATAATPCRSLPRANWRTRLSAWATKIVARVRQVFTDRPQPMHGRASPIRG